MQVKLLIIESDNYFRNHLVKRLSDKDKWSMLFAEHRIETLKMVRNKNIDVVLLSLKDLKNEGLIILRELKNICPLIEVITISRADQITLSIEGMKLGAFDDVIVPFDVETLILRIQEAHEKKIENEAIQKISRRRLREKRFQYGCRKMEK